MVRMESSSSSPTDHRPWLFCQDRVHNTHPPLAASFSQGCTDHSGSRIIAPTFHRVCQSSPFTPRDAYLSGIHHQSQFSSLHAQEHALKACFWEHQPELIWCLYIDVLPMNPSIREFSPTFSPFHFHCPDLCDIASSRHTSMLLWLLKLVLYRFGGQKWDVSVMGKQPASHGGANLLRRTVALCCSQSPSSSLAEAVKLEERIHFPLTIMITQTMGKKKTTKNHEAL